MTSLGAHCTPKTNNRASHGARVKRCHEKDSLTSSRSTVEKKTFDEMPKVDEQRTSIHYGGQRLLCRNESDTKLNGTLYNLEAEQHTLEEENSFDTEQQKVVNGLHALPVEELCRRLKQAKQELQAKSDAFELIYSQWQNIQKELETKTKSEVNLQARLAIVEKRLQQKDELIDDLQFEVFWAQSELEEKCQKENEAELLLRESEKLTVKRTATSGPSCGLSSSLASSCTTWVSPLRGHISYNESAVAETRILFKDPKRKSFISSMLKRPYSKMGTENKQMMTRRGWFGRALPKKDSSGFIRSVRL